MRNIIAIIIIAIIGLTAAGCARVYDLFGTTPEEVHKIAVQKVSDFAEAAVNKKIEASETLSDAGKEKLKAEVARLKAEILARIAEIKEKTKTGGEGK